MPLDQQAEPLRYASSKLGEFMRITKSGLFCLFVVMVSLGTVERSNAEQTVEMANLEEGKMISLGEIELLQSFLPEDLWSNRHLLFYEGMQLTIGPAFRDYSPPPEYLAATERNRGQAKVGPSGSLQNHAEGLPFPMDEVECSNDPQAGVKIAWNFDQRWNGDGAKISFRYTYWDRGEQQPLHYEGSGRFVQLTRRIEESFRKSDGDIFKGDPRKHAMGIEVEEPGSAKGTKVLTYRYKSSELPPDQAKSDDLWVYLPDMRRVRRIPVVRGYEAVQGTDFSFDDLLSFSGKVPEYTWECLEERVIIAPMNSQIRAYPYDKDVDFGPLGLSFASDLWELRNAVRISMVPRDENHPYSRKDMYLDSQTFEPLYGLAWDRNGDLWKIIWHDHRWSEDDPDWYSGWEGVANPRDLRVVGDIIINVQTGTGNRIEFWDTHGMPVENLRMLRQYIDVKRLYQSR